MIGKIYFMILVQSILKLKSVLFSYFDKLHVFRSLFNVLRWLIAKLLGTNTDAIIFVKASLYHEENTSITLNMPILRMHACNIMFVFALILKWKKAFADCLIEYWGLNGSAAGVSCNFMTGGSLGKLDIEIKLTD